MRTQPLVASALVAVLAGACSHAASDRDAHFARGNAALDARQYQLAVVEYSNAVKADAKFGQARAKLSEAYFATGNAERGFRELIRAADLLPADNEIQLKAGGALLVARQFDDAGSRARQVLARDPRNVDALLLLGNAQAGLDNMADALKQLQEAVALDPSRVESYANLAVVQYGTGKAAEAGKTFEKAVAMAPGSASARLALANYYWSAGRRADAERELKRSVELDPQNPIANRALALLFMISGRTADAEKPLLAVAARDTAAKFALADFYIATNRQAVARRTLESMARNDATRIAARIRLAELQYSEGDHAGAQLALLDVLGDTPKNLDALSTRARWLLADGKLDEAEKAASTAAGLEDKAVAPRYVLGLVQSARNQLGPAAHSFESVLQINPRAIAARVQLAHVYLAQGRGDRALTLTQQVLDNLPSHVEARRLHAHILLGRGDVAGAEADLTALRASVPKAAAVDLIDATIGLARHDLRRARRGFETALQRDPRLVEAFAGLVTLDVIEKHPEAARARLDRAIALNPNSRDLLLLAAKTYLAGGDLPRAERTLNTLVALDPDHLSAYELLARVYLSEGKLDAALARFDESLRRNPQSVPTQTIAATLVHAQNRIPEAIRRYEAILQTTPNAVVSANNLAWIYAERGDNLDRALQLAQSARQQAPDEPQIADTLAWVYYKRHVPSLAIPELERAVQLQPGNPVFHYHLGVALLETGDTGRARAELQHALSLQGDFDGAAEARRALARIAG